MADPVTDVITDWQINTPPGTDLNLPANQNKMTVTSATSLPGELRSIKSVTRQFTTDPVWINFTGLKTPPSPDPTGAAAVLQNLNTFTLLGDWTSIATVGRSVRATFKDTTPQAATPIYRDPVYDGTVTTIQLLDAILTAPLAYVEFSAINPDPAVNPFWLNFDPTVQAATGDFVVPISQGGTGGTVGPGTLAGDAVGPIGSNTVQQIRNTPIDLTGLTANNVLASVNVPPLTWQARTLTELLSLSQSTATPDRGFVTFGADAAFPGNTPIILNWWKVDNLTPGDQTPLTWVQPFPSLCLGVWALAGGGGVPCAFLLSVTSVNATTVTIRADIPFTSANPTGQAFPANTSMFILGIGI